MLKNIDKDSKNKIIIFIIIFVAITILGLINKQHLVNAIDSPLGYLILALWSFSESSLFPIPPDPGLIILAGKGNWLFVAVFTTIFSVMGAVLGYYIGKKYGHSILVKLIDKKTIVKAEKVFEKWSGASILVAGITPVPFKVFTILSGVMEVKLQQLIFYSVIARTIRFILVAYVGTGILQNEFVKNNFEVLTIAITIMLVIILSVYVSVKKLKNKKRG